MPAGLDITKMYPAEAPPDKELADRWAWDAFRDDAEKLFKAGYPFGMPFGETSDASSSGHFRHQRG